MPNRPLPNGPLPNGPLPHNLPNNDTERLISRAGAIGTDASDNDLRRLVNSGAYERLWRGHYLSTPAPTDGPDNVYAQARERYRLTVIAAARSSKGDRVVSFTSAAALLGVPLLAPDVGPVYFTTMTGTGRTAGNAVIRQAPIDPVDLIELDGVRLTGLARTVADVARMGTFEQAITALDQGRRCGAALPDLERIAATQKRWHGVGLLRRAIGLSTPESASVGESYSRALMYRFDDIPHPDVQVELTVDGGRARVWCDFGWEGKVVGEFDGHVKYTRDRAFHPGRVEDVLFDEKRREDAIREQGIWVIRWTWDDLRDPRAFHHKLVEGLRRAGIL